ncbi:MAG: TonB-dependent receptor [Lacinutrix sp.]
MNFDQITQNNIDSANSGIGNFGDSYLRRSSVNNHNWYGLLSNLNIEKTENLSFNVGIDARTYRGDHFRQVNNFLGLTGYNDNFRTDRPSDYVISQSFEANPCSALFDFADEDQRYDRDYSENINYIGGFAQAEYKQDSFSAFFQGAVSTQSYQREGRLTGRGDGLGKSEKISKAGYNLKAGAAYKINVQHSFFANAGVYSRQPFLDNIFADIRYSNRLVEPEVENEEIVGFEGGYRFKNDVFRLNIDVYNTTWGNRFLAINGPQQANDETSTYRLNDVTQVHNGIEFDMEYRGFGPKLNLKAYGSIGNWKYEGETPYNLQNDETGDFITTDGKVNLTNVKIGNAPQTSFGLGLRTQLFKGFSADLDYNLYTDLYEFVDPADVAADALAGRTYNSVRLPAYTLADAGVTYNFDLGANKMTFRANVFNLFNKAYINQRDAFGYYLGIGRTFNASMRYNF